MSIMIKGIDIPINCTRCPCSDDETRFCRAANKYIPMIGKPNFCPLAEAEERKTGKWIQETMHYKDAEQEFYYCEEHCSICGEKRKIGWGHVSFCPNCGADMRGEKNGIIG